MSEVRKEVQVGTILVHSIGCGCDSYYQVIKRSPRKVVCRKVQDKIVNRKIKYQTYDVLPVKNKFIENEEPITLGISPTGQIGPSKRMIWWSVWDGKAQNQWCN